MLFDLFYIKYLECRNNREQYVGSLYDGRICGEILAGKAQDIREYVFRY